MKNLRVIPAKPEPLKLKRVAAYCRVSLESERMHHSLATQVSFYNSLIQENPLWIFAGVFSDDGISGTSVARPGFQSLIKACDDGLVDIVLTKSISRFARNTVDLLNTIRHLKDLGIEVRFEREKINTLSTDTETFSTKKNRRVAGYARVSTDKDEQFTSYQAQIDYYTQFIQSHAGWDYVNVYTDEGISGTSTLHRTGFQNMISDALDGKIDLIVTKSLSRFARNTVDSLITIRKLKEHKVECYFEKENIWTFDSKGGGASYNSQFPGSRGKQIHF